MSRKKTKALTKPARATLGIKYSEIEELRMRRACVEAAKFMSTYGKGHRPYMVDLSHYENGKIDNYGENETEADGKHQKKTAGKDKSENEHAHQV